MLITKNVFIDTQAFYKKQFKFTSSTFEVFQSLCEIGALNHISTPVVVGECKSNLKKIITDSVSRRKKFIKEFSILKNIGEGNEKIAKLFEQIDHSEIFSEAEKVFDRYLLMCKTNLISANGLDVDDLTRRYFNKLPPFSEAKKDEFPDAISLLAIKHFLGDNDKIYIVSADEDLIAFCNEFPNQFLIAPSLEHILGLHSETVNARFDLIVELVTQHTADLETKIKDYIEARDVWNNSTWDDSRVEDHVRVIEIRAFESNVIYATELECGVSIDFEVDFEVTVIGPDFNGAFYDREDKTVYVLDETQRNEIVTESLTAMIGISYDIAEGQIKNVDFGDIHIEEIHAGIEVSVEENEAPEYR